MSAWTNDVNGAASGSASTVDLHPLLTDHTSSSSERSSPVAPLPPPLYLFDPPSRLSHSHLWRLNHSYYSNYGHLPFANGTVPHFITSNAYTAHHTAQLILAHLLAHPTHTLPDPQHPLYIIEAGAGHGRHTFLTLQALSALISDTAASSTAGLPVWRYVCTDVSVDGLRALCFHPSLQPFIHSHRLDFAILHDDCWGASGGSSGGGGDGYELHCLVSGDVISKHTNRNPIFLSAAYTFSALACDAWQQRSDGLYEGHLSLWSERADDTIDRTDPQLLQRLTERWEWLRVDSKQVDSYYPPKLQSVFEQSVRRLAGTTGSTHPSFSFLFPVSALLLLYRFLSLSHDQLTLIILDKAHAMAADSASTPDALRPPHLARHGSTSVMLSLLPLHVAVEAVRYGVTDTSGWREGGFVASLLSTQLPTAGTVAVRLAFQRLKGLTPDGFSVLVRCVRDGEVGLGVLCWLLRLAHHDCDVYYRVSHRLLALLHEATVSEKQRADLVRDCQQLMRNYYPLDVYQPSSNTATSSPLASTSTQSPFFSTQHRDVAFELGRLCLALATHSAALLCFECSWRDCGPHALTAYYLSTCEWLMGKQAMGREWMAVAERLAVNDDEVEVLRAWRSTVDQREDGPGAASNGAVSY